MPALLYNYCMPFMVRKVTRDLVGDRPLGEPYLTNESDEFLEAFRARNQRAVEEELQDVMFGAQMLAHQATRKNFPILGADEKIREFYRRKDAFKRMFKERGLKFNTDYYVGGSNIKKPAKIRAAFELAGHPITDEEAAMFSQKYGSYDLTSLAPKWNERGHIRAALRNHLARSLETIGTKDEKKELMDLYLITNAYRKNHVPQEFQDKRWGRFQETATLPRLRGTEGNLKMKKTAAEIAQAVLEKLAFSDIRLDSGAAANRQALRQKYLDAGWDQRWSDIYSNNAADMLFKQQMAQGRGAAGMADAVAQFQAPRNVP